MTMFLVILSLLLIVVLGATLLKLKTQNAQIKKIEEASEAFRKHYESEALRVHSEAQSSLARAQETLNQELENATIESERIRKH